MDEGSLAGIDIAPVSKARATDGGRIGTDSGVPS